jgi:hypothetical protein
MKIGYIKVEIRPIILRESGHRELRVEVECEGKKAISNMEVAESDFETYFDLYMNVAKDEVRKKLQEVRG